MRLSLISPSRISRRVGKSGPGGIQATISVETAGLTFDVGGSALLKRMGNLAVEDVQRNIRAGSAGGKPLPAITEGTAKRRAQMAKRIESGTPTPYMEKRYKVRGASPMRDSSGLDLLTPGHFTGGFARSVRAIPAGQTGSRLYLKLVAARVYDDLQERYAARGYTLLDLSDIGRARIGKLAEDHVARAVKPGGASGSRYGIADLVAAATRALDLASDLAEAG